MEVSEIYRTLRQMGIMLQSAPEGAIKWEAPKAIKAEEVAAFLQGRKEEMYAYLVEVEELAAIIESNDVSPRMAILYAVKNVNERRADERDPPEFRRVRSHPQFMAFEDGWRQAFGSGLEIISVGKLAA